MRLPADQLVVASRPAIVSGCVGSKRCALVVHVVDWGVAHSALRVCVSSWLYPAVAPAYRSPLDMGAVVKAPTAVPTPPPAPPAPAPPSYLIFRAYFMEEVEVGPCVHGVRCFMNLASVVLLWYAPCLHVCLCGV
jgi:hypothetical protein